MSKTYSMSETVKLSIERNGVSLNFVEREKTRGEAKGEKYIGIDRTVTREQLEQWFGVETVDGWIRAKADALTQGWDKEAKGEDGIFNEEEFKQLALGISQRGETMAALKEKLEDLEDQFLAEDLSDTDMRSLAKQIKEVKAAINSKKRERTPKAPEVATA